MLRSFYNQMLLLAARPNAPWWLFGTAFAEASFFPLPPDALLIPMVLARPNRGWWLALICTVGSILGAGLGYLIGAEFFDHIARPLLSAYGYLPRFAIFQQKFAEYGFEIILLKGLTPIPFKIVTIASGVAHVDFGLFWLACTITRGARFFLVAGVLKFFGDRARVFLERYLNWVALALLVGIVVGFLALRYV